MVFLQLSAAQREELRRLSPTAVGRVALRALMVLWRAEGHSTLEIAQRLGCDRETITPWVERYLQHGLAGLADQPRSGRPRHLDPATMDVVEAALDGRPRTRRRPPAGLSPGGAPGLSRWPGRPSGARPCAAGSMRPASAGAGRASGPTATIRRASRSNC